MRIDAVTIREIRTRLKFPFETSFGSARERRPLLVTVASGGVEGIAECVAGESPGYGYETTGTCWHVLEQYLVPRVLGEEFANAGELLQRLSPIRGHNMAVAAVEMAFWDLQAKKLQTPLWQLLGGTRREVPVGVSLGIQESLERTVDLARQHVEEGYRRVKLKIKPGWDVQPVAAVREALPEVSLTVDANSAYRLADARRLQELDAFGLDYIEQPLAHDDLVDHAALQGLLSTPICLDESIHSPDDARKALALGSARIINVKAGRVRGLREAVRVHDVSTAFGAPVWCGGMLETGIGRAHNLHLSTLEGFVLPGDTSSASRYWAEDIVEEALEANDGVQQVPEGPGIGVTPRMGSIERMTEAVRRFEG